MSTLALLQAFAPAQAASPRDGLRPTASFPQARPETARPPMGWNPWNAFRTDVDEAKVMAAANALVTTGLAAKGYRYVNIDDGWIQQRDRKGRLVVRTSMFPSARAPSDGLTSLRPFTDRLHALGLKAGLYTDIGRNTCAQRWDAHGANQPTGTLAAREVGSFGHQRADAKLIFRKWHFDYLKADACGVADYAQGSTLVAQGVFAPFNTLIVRGRSDESDATEVRRLYADLKAAVAAQGRPFVFSICAWGEARSNDWGGEVGDLWRTSADIDSSWKSMLHNLDSASQRSLFGGPGRWNDPDMLALGKGDFGPGRTTEQRSHFSLWAMLGAPLILGLDLRAPDPGILKVVGNEDVIAIDQDIAGNQARLVVTEPGREVFVKELADRRQAIALFNRLDVATRASVTWPQLGLKPGSDAVLRDLWTGREFHARDHFDIDLAPHETLLLETRGMRDTPGIRTLGELPARVFVAANGVARLPEPLPGMVAPAMLDATPVGTAIKIAGVGYDHGLGALVHSRVTLDLRREFHRFRVKVGVPDDGAPATGRVTFWVYADGRPIASVRDRSKGEPAAALDLNVKGVRVLDLVADAPPAKTVPSFVAWANAELVL